MSGVLEMFRHREWKPAIVRELRGTNGRLTIVLNDMPCLRNALDGVRKFAFVEFGSELLESLCAVQFADLDHVRRLVSMGEKTAYVRLRGLSPVAVHVSGQIARDSDRFCSDLADCLVIAFRAKQLLH